MRTYSVQMVGQPAQPVVMVEACNALHAVALQAGCDVSAVCLPIWRAPIGTECYMPRDDSGRQWLVHQA